MSSWLPIYIFQVTECLPRRALQIWRTSWCCDVGTTRQKWGPILTKSRKTSNASRKSCSTGLKGNEIGACCVVSVWVIADLKSLVLGRSGCNFKNAILNNVLVIDFSDLFRRPWNLTDDESTMVQVMAWQQAINWANVDPVLLYSITKPQWINSLWSSNAVCCS